MKHLLIIYAIAALIIVSSNTAQATIWLIPDDFDTIQEAIDSVNVQDGDTIIVQAGYHAGALVSKCVEIKGEDGAVIDSGPSHSSGLIMGFRLLTGSDGTTISHLDFTVDLAIMNGDAVDCVTVQNCTFTNTIQAVSNWGGSEWQISHNVITDLRTRNGGGIGILVGGRFGGVIENNVISHNKISGMLHVWENDGGGYAGSGIVLYADLRWGFPGAEAIQNNVVIKNNVSLVSDTPEVVDVVAIELTEHGTPEAGWPLTPPDPHVICNNAVGFNDLRGTILQLALSPDDLDECNDISRNLGENRGQGLHPSVFGVGID